MKIKIALSMILAFAVQTLHAEAQPQPAYLTFCFHEGAVQMFGVNVYEEIRKKLNELTAKNPVIVAYDEQTSCNMTYGRMFVPETSDKAHLEDFTAKAYDLDAGRSSFVEVKKETSHMESHFMCSQLTRDAAFQLFYFMAPNMPNFFKAALYKNQQMKASGQAATFLRISPSDPVGEKSNDKLADSDYASFSCENESTYEDVSKLVEASVKR